MGKGGGKGGVVVSFERGGGGVIIYQLQASTRSAGEMGPD